ncbi:MAG: M1 family aminopeptidase [Candidatus Omnitrophota bacterium]|nr:M1 family aminopeptidase [Candidatus Omnitrophota bacterium]
MAKSSVSFITLCIICIFIFLSTDFSFGFENPRYEIECSLDTNNHLLFAKEKVIFFNNSLEEVSEVFFHIYPHRQFTKEEKEFILRYAGYFKINPFAEGFQSGDLKIKSIKQGNLNLSYNFEGEDKTMLRVNLLKPLLPWQSLELTLDFDLEIPHSFGRFGWHKNIISLVRWYPILSVLDEEGWHNYPFYPFHQPYFSQASFYKLKLTLPKGEVVIHTGSLVKEINNQDTTKTILIETEFPARDFSLAISPDYKVFSLTQNGLKINSYYLEGDEFYAKKALEFSSQLIINYSKNFANYPYKEFNIAPVYLAYGGAQSSNLILIDTRAYKLPRILLRYFDFLISHETGHQWFYNIVGSDEYKEMWLDEGLNSYFILNYLEEKYGRDAFVMELPKPFKYLIPNFSFRRARDFRYTYLAKNGLDRPILGELSSFQEPSSIFALTYGKGASIVGMLHSLVGDEIFSRIFKRYFKEFRFRNIKFKDFMRIANEESQEDLNWFFEEWLKTNKKCDYSIKEVKNNKIILQNLSSIEMPFETEINFSDGTSLIDYWDGQGRFREIKLNKASQVKEVRLDSKKKLLDIDRTNNYWPRKFFKKAVPIYHEIYEIPVFLPEDSYNFVFGPEVTKGGLGLKASLQKPFDNILFFSSDYDLNSNKINSTLGYELRHLLNKQIALGFELFKNKDLDGRIDDLDGGKLYLRRELWPASYGLTEINDHISFYIVRNRRFDGGVTTGGLEQIKNFSYLKNDEAILGTTFFINRSGPYFDPRLGYKLSATVENAEHFLGGKEYFWRQMLDWQLFKPFFKDTQIATRLKFGFGFPTDKNLYQLGGNEGLRGFDLKTIRGSQTMLGSLEYRFPLRKDLNCRLFDNIISFDELQGVLFFDAGKSWYSNFSAANFKKDAGLGLRLHLNLGSFFERIVLRLDVGRAIDAPKEKAHVWIGINQAF